MREIYLVGKYGKVSSYGKTLKAVVHTQKGIKEQIYPVKTIDVLITAGSIEISENARRLMVYNGVTHISMSYRGLRVVYYVPAMNRFTTTHMQAIAYTLYKLEIAKRIENQMLSFLELHADRLGYSLSLEDIYDKIENASRIPEIESYEGEAWKRYYSIIAKILPGFSRNNETRHPPKDHYNALVSLSYSALYSLVLRRILVEGLEPKLGFIHHRSLISLALDLAEPLKVIAMEFVINNHKEFKTKPINKGKAVGYYLDFEDLGKFYRKRGVRMREKMMGKSNNLNTIKSFVKRFLEQVRDHAQSARI